MDITIIIAIVAVIIASAYNDAQKRRRATQEDQESPIEPTLDEPIRPESPMDLPQKQIPWPRLESFPRPSHAFPGDTTHLEAFQRKIKAANQATTPTKRVVAKAAPTTNEAKRANETRCTEEPFDAKRAIIYSEILQPKFKEYE